MQAATGDNAADASRAIIRYCRTHGIAITIATAQPCSTFFSEQQRLFLKDLGILDLDPQYCPGQDSEPDANGSVKGPMLQQILKELKVQPDRVVFFDDQPGNLVTAEELGINGKLVNKEGVGMTEDDFQEAITLHSPEACIFDLDYTLTKPTLKEGYLSLCREKGRSLYFLIVVAAAVIILKVMLHF